MSTAAHELIYVVEDDPRVSQLIEKALKGFSFRCEMFTNGSDFLRRSRVQAPHVALLDLGLPDMDGLQVIQKLGPQHGFGILVVTGRSDSHDCVMALELGADDYVVKPFEPRELVARVRSVVRRYRDPAPAPDAVKSARFSGWRFELATHLLMSPDGSESTLSVAEASLLKVMLERPNQILSREQLLDGRDVDALDRSIDLRVSRLRRRLEENPQHAKIIKTVYGAGYLFASTVTWE